MKGVDIRRSIRTFLVVFDKTTHSVHLSLGGPLRAGGRRSTAQLRKGAPALAAFHSVKVPKQKHVFECVNERATEGGREGGREGELS